MPVDNVKRQPLLQSNRMAVSQNEKNKIQKYCLAFLIICIVCAPIAYILSYFVSGLIEIEPCQKRVIGYYSYWEETTLTVNQLSKLTHIIFMFVFIQADGSIRIDNRNNTEYEKRIWEMKETISTAQKSGLKVMMAVGGHETSHLFAPTVRNPEKRKNLLNSVINLFHEYDIDGIEIFWMFPLRKDSVNHVKLIKDLRQRLTSLKNEKKRTEDYVLSAITSRYTHRRENIYYNEIMKYVDFVNVITYDWDMSRSVVGPISALYGGERDSIDEAMNTFTCSTRQPNKFNIVVPLFSIYWSNISFPFDDNTNRLYTPNDGGQTSYAMFFGREETTGSWKKSEISWHNKSRSSYIWKEKGRAFASIENEQSLMEKANYVREKNLGGITIYVLEQDHGKNLIDAITSVNLCSGDRNDEIKYTCES